jgi:hypothetical protein
VARPGPRPRGGPAGACQAAAGRTPLVRSPRSSHAQLAVAPAVRGWRRELEEGKIEAVGAHRGNMAPMRRRRRRFMTVFCRRRQLPAMKYGATVFTSLRGSRGGCRATRWGSGAHRAVARHEGGWCGDALRQRRCFGGRSWLEEGPAAPNEGGDSEGGSKSKQC